VAAAAPRIQFYTSIYENEQTYNGVGIGVDFEREKAFMDPEASLVAGRLPRPGERELLLTTGLAEEVGVGAGDRVTLLGKNMYMGMAGMTFTVSGIARFPVEGFNERFMVVPLPAAQSFLKMDDSVTEILVKARDRGGLDEAADRLAARLALGGSDAVPGSAAGSGDPALEVEPWMAIGSWFSLMRISNVSYNLMALFFFLLGTTVIINTTMMVIYERMREIGTVSALGMTGPEIVKLFFLEAFFIGLIASLVGAGLGVVLTIPLSVNGIDVGALFEGIDFEVSSVLYPRLNLRSTLFVFVYSVVVASLASLVPSRRAAKIQPVEALRAI
jgi:putative ABC transport system permease protein